MDFRPQPQFARGLENTGRLFDREKTFVAEDVDEIFDNPKTEKLKAFLLNSTSTFE